MLVFTRKKDETIHVDIGGGIEIMLVEVKGDRAKIGVHASRDIPVHRGEVWEEIQRGAADKKKQEYLDGR